MMEITSSTLYAPAERSSPEVIDIQADEFQHATLLRTIADAIPTILVILNKQRQIVYTNKRLLELSETEGWEQVKGKRPGEVLDCVHASESPGGCGTTEFCQTCGAVNAILDSQKGMQSVQECRIRNKAEEALDLRVWATPYKHNSELFTIFAVLDVSNEKRRQILERIFFHDVLNVAGNIWGLSQILQDEDDSKEASDMVKLIHHSSKLLIEEIQLQRQLSESERGDLEVSSSEVSSIALLREVADTYSEHEVAEDRSISIEKASQDCTILTDPVILRRVLGNMVKNALEATSPGGTVVLSCATKQNEVEFSVHNNSNISREVQLQLFQRSFSTKGTGRGIGTHSMKLLGEKYLGGAVWFKSSEEHGTTFFLRLPIVERRKKNRFKVRSGAFASIQFDDLTIGLIIDISKDGLAFRYIGEERPISKSVEVDISVVGKGFYIKKIPSKIISDFNIDKKKLYNSLSIRQCGMQFCEPNDDQISRLDDFIQKYIDRRSGKDRRQFSDPNYSGEERRIWINRRTGPLLS